MSDFVHLHLHTDYSLLDGAIQIKPLAARIRELGMKSCAMTDHGNIYGAVSFYREMKAQGIKPIIGCEVYLAPASRFDKREAPKGEKPYNHMILLAKDREGYHNLVKLTSKAFCEGFYHRPRIDRELLSTYSKGLIGLSACLSGVPQHNLKNGRLAAAETSALEFQEIMGKGNYFLEIQNHQLPEQERINKNLIELSKKTEIPLVATNDSHYLHREDYEAHDILLCIGTGKTVNDPNRMQFGGPEWYVRSAEEMRSIFEFAPGAVERTVEIAAMCDLNLPLGENQLPVYPIPREEDDISIEAYFEKIVIAGYEKRRAKFWEPRAADGRLKRRLDEYEARINREIAMINQMGFASYFLIVWDFIKFAKERGIPVGPGRGSAAGSLVAYCLEITDVDPLEYDLLFERFLNPDRVSMPDIDIDFCVHGRAEVIDHVTELYGRDSVCQIITFGTMASRAAIKDVGRALDMPYAEVEKIAKLIPPPIRGRNVSIDQAVEMVPELRRALESDEQVKKVIEIARRLEGCARHASVHAAGVVISPKPLDDLIPVAVSQKQELTTQFGMSDLEKAGMLKMDFLGLTTLSIIDECCRTIKEISGRAIVWDETPLDDAKTYELFAEGRTDAIFQFESAGMQEITRKLRPKCIEDLSALNALFRPGPLDGGMVDDFIERYHGRRPVEYILPQMEEILSNTYGILVYQEQIMQLAQKLGGYSLGEADLMRRAMGKKKRDEMARHEEKFISGCIQTKIPKKKAKEIFRLMAQFADYGFNRSHSVAYALVAYQTAYLKAHFPEHFYAAVMTYAVDDTAKIFKYASELKARGIRLLAPDINESRSGFTPVEGAIRFGLSAIKGLGHSAVNAIIEARASKPFTSMFDLAERLSEKGGGKRVLESLVCSGAFDSLKPEDESLFAWRPCLFATVDRALEIGARRRDERASGQEHLFGRVDVEVIPQLKQAERWTQKQLLANEKAAVGFYVSGHPLQEHFEKISSLACTSVADLGTKVDPGGRVRLAGVVSEFTLRNTRKGDRYAFFRLEDLSGASVKCVLWPEALEKKGQDAANDALLLVTGKRDSTTDGMVTILCDEVAKLEKVSAASAERPQTLLIEIPDDLDVSEAVCQALLQSPGDSDVLIELARRKQGLVVRARTARSLRVRSSKILNDQLTDLGVRFRWSETA